jgi:hypothetical protein
MAPTHTLTALVLALGLSVGACGEQSAPTAASDIDSQIAFNFTNGPGAPGNSGVFRGQDGFVTFTNDPTRDWLGVHFQADNSAVFCGGTEGFELSDFNAVNNQDDIIRIISQLRDAPLFLYRTSEFPGFGDPVELCRWFSEDWLYQGIHDLVYRDNDFTNAGPGANAFAFLGHGTVYDPSGGRHQYNEQQAALILPDGTFDWKLENIRVTNSN